MRKLFLTGLILILPLAITLWFVKAFVSFFTLPFEQITTAIFHIFGVNSSGFWIFSGEEILHFCSRIAIVLSLTLCFFLLGYIGNRFENFLNKFLLSTPIVKTIYRNCKKFINALFSSPKLPAFQVAYVPFPTVNDRVLAIVMRKVSIKQTPYILALIPTSPNPTVGLHLFFPEEIITYEPLLTTKQALSLALSCGSLPQKQ